MFKLLFIIYNVPVIYTYLYIYIYIYKKLITRRIVKYNVCHSYILVQQMFFFKCRKATILSTKFMA